MQEHPKAAMREFVVSESCFAAGKPIVELGFPKTAIIAMIRRDQKYLTPNGATVILPQDTLIVLSDSQKGLEEVDLCLNNKDLMG